MYQWLRSVGSGRPTRSDFAVCVALFPTSPSTASPWWLFLYEALAIFAFGVSWFVKGQTLIGPVKDVPTVAEPVIQH
jgi:hypothetical protein